MDQFISISEVAKELGISYFVARNRLRRNPVTKAMAMKVGSAVVYKREALEAIKNAAQEPR